MIFSGSKFEKGNPSLFYRTWDSLTLAGDSPALRLAILQLYTRNVMTCSGAKHHCMSQHFKHLALTLQV